jgi:hypothetical protein
MNKLKYLLIFISCYFILSFFYSVFISKGEVLPFIQLLNACNFGFLAFVVHQKTKSVSPERCSLK